MAQAFVELVEEAVGLLALATGKRRQPDHQPAQAFLDGAEIALVTLHPLQGEVVFTLPDVVLLHAVPQGLT
ncbi:hypothetical protein FIV34_03530 [Luteibacter pinisoli]|uniref:Uncharacterized protein n=1 Tax=Luteibacter pinisoli TaxID=2589080 RepID=A0A4Y5Z0H9_9GAMM|nr:hypothetical protein FIV34_03530 [Luteibacter pinisoli]